MRPADRSAAGRERLATALASHFGLDEQAVLGFLTSGRKVRARGGLDEDDAKSLSAELEKLGAVVAVEPALPPRAPAYESGLSNAMTTAPAPPDAHSLGALARDDGLTLSSLDGEVVETLGNEDALSRPMSVPVMPAAPAKPPSTSPPSQAAKKSPATSQSGPSVPPTPQGGARVEFRPSGQTPATSAPRPATPPPDPFAPPQEIAPAEIELAYPEPRPSKQLPIAVGSGPHSTAQPRTSGETGIVRPSGPATPRVSGQISAASPASPAATSSPPIAAELAPGPAVRPRPSLADPRARLGIAIFAGLLLGFLAAQLYSSGAEDKLDEIRLELLREPIAQTTDEYQQALERHEVARGRMERTKRRIELAAGFLWIAIGGGVSYATWKFFPRTPSDGRAA